MGTNTSSISSIENDIKILRVDPDERLAFLGDGVSVNDGFQCEFLLIQAFVLRFERGIRSLCCCFRAHHLMLTSLLLSVLSSSSTFLSYSCLGRLSRWCSHRGHEVTIPTSKRKDFDYRTFLRSRNRTLPCRVYHSPDKQSSRQHRLRSSKVSCLDSKVFPLASWLTLSLSHQSWKRQLGRCVRQNGFRSS